MIILQKKGKSAAGKPKGPSLRPMLPPGCVFGWLKLDESIINEGVKK
jgi:hypothetical protein